MEMKLPNGTEVTVSQVHTEAWEPYVMSVTIGTHTLIGMTDEDPNEITQLMYVSQQLGQVQAAATPEGIKCQSQHVVVPYGGAGILKSVLVGRYDFAFRLIDMLPQNPKSSEKNNWVMNALRQYAAPLDTTGLIAAPVGFNPNGPPQ